MTVDAILLNPTNLLIICFVWVLLSMLQNYLPVLERNKTFVRLLPLLPIVICSIIVWIPGAAPHAPTAMYKVMLGVVLGAMAANGHKIFRQTALGQDDRIKPKGLGQL